MSEVIEVNRIEDLEAYRLLWNALLPRTPGASFFQSLDWLTAYWHHFGQNQKLRVLIVHSGGRPIGIVPLTVIREFKKVGPVRVLTYPLHDWGSFYGPIGPEPAATLAAAMGHIRRTARDWDLIDLRWTDTEGHDHGRTQRAMQVAGFQGVKGVWKETALIDTRGTWEEYLATRTTKFRNNLRRQQRRIAELGKVDYVCYRPLGEAHDDGDPRWDLYDACLDLASRSWQGSSDDGTTLSHKSVHDYFRQAHGLAAKAGALDLNLLTLDGEPIAFSYNYHYQGYVYGLRIGYDPRFAKAGLGNVLYARTFQNCFEQGDHTLDMGPGSLQIKQQWLTHIATSFHYTHYPVSVPRVQLLRMKHWWDRREEAPSGTEVGKLGA